MLRKQANGFVHFDDKIHVDFDFMIKSITLDHLEGDFVRSNDAMEMEQRI
jgi:hypothetical protein